MKQDEILGIEYNRTFGAILNYQKLASFLLKKKILEDNDRLIDLACGTGSLIHEIRNIHKSISLVGIDIDIEQLKIARKYNSDALFISEDLFTFSIGDYIDSQNWIAHLGFSFINRLTYDEIVKLVHNLTKNKQITCVLTEIWNYEYQLNHFQYDKWYRTKLPEGFLMTKSDKKDRSDNVIDIDFEFHINDKVQKSSYTMFRYQTDVIESIFKKAGWNFFEVESSSYRESGESHNFISIKR
ncbi:MAG: class I SAM-dependent methyltransferase [Bacteroidales bacterium]|jgi:hypothetical protein|nr:class I SAM-dependent methyltransferase [Bacteroidales bacterium]